MVQKRPFDAEETLEVSFKHPKQVGPSNQHVSCNQHVSFAESVFPEDVSHIPGTSVELPGGAVEFETSYPGGSSDFSWGTSGTCEDVLSEPPLHLPFEPEYFSLERPVRTLVRREDIYSILFEHPPHRDVPVGPDHQADIPEWGSGSSSRLNASDAVKDEVDERFMGTCIIPMPRMEFENNEVGKGRTDCSCGDWGSMRCVKQHIVEAREELRKKIGNGKFVDLGFSNMGEQVADKWSAEEEQLFHEVVFNNPVTLDKTFWDYFPIAFPSKTKKETVSYYFNVFMLRRRAEQNRSDLLNIDSDDDEWHGDDVNGMETPEDDEDNVAKSPVHQDDEACLANCHENDLQDNDEYTSDETCAVNETVDFAERNIVDDSKYDCSEMPPFIGFPSIIQPHDQTDWQERFGEEAQDVSCRSCKAGVASQEAQVKIKNGDHWCRNYNREPNSYSQGYVLEPCDAKD